MVYYSRVEYIIVYGGIVQYDILYSSLEALYWAPVKEFAFFQVTIIGIQGK